MKKGPMIILDYETAIVIFETYIKSDDLLNAAKATKKAVRKFKKALGLEVNS